MLSLLDLRKRTSGSNRRSPPAPWAKLPAISSLNPRRRHPNRTAPRRTNPMSRSPLVSPTVPALVSLSPHVTWMRRPSDRSCPWRRRRWHSYNALRQRDLRCKRRQKECNTQELHCSPSKSNQCTQAAATNLQRGKRMEPMLVDSAWRDERSRPISRSWKWGRISVIAKCLNSSLNAFLGCPNR